MQPRNRRHRELNNYARLREAAIENRYTYRRCRDRPGIKGVRLGVSSINRLSTGFQACRLLLVYLQHEVHRGRRSVRPCRRCSGETFGNGVARADKGGIGGGGGGGSRDRGEGQTRPPGGCSLHRAYRLHRSGRVHGCLQVPFLRGVHRLPVLRRGLRSALHSALLRPLNTWISHQTTGPPT